MNTGQRGVTLAALFALVLLNPLTYSLGGVAGGVFPDSLLYLVQGRELLEHGRLFVAGWGHVDSGVVLPPLYPALVGVGASVGGDAILASYWVSTGALALAVLPWFFFARRRTGPWFALAAAATAQLQAAYLVYATSSLTEGLFILVLSALIPWTACVLERPRSTQIVALGAGAALLFLTRQIGLFFVPVLMLLLVLGALTAEGPRVRLAAMRVALAGLGFLLLMAPYSTVLYLQTGHSPFVQHFRLNQYVVKAPEGLAPDVARGTTDPRDYEDIYRGRREAHRLLPDSSEMYANLVQDDVPPEAAPGFPPAAWIRNAGLNLRHLAASLGWFATVLLGLALLSSLVGRRAPAERMLPIVIVAYFGTISLVSGHIARYLEILFPFAILLIFGECFHRSRPLLSSRFRNVQAILPAALALALVLAMPQTAFGLKLSPRFGESGNPLAACAEYLKGRAPVFGFHPLGAYLAGGYYRAVPNDTLDKVIAYGQKTGVEWLLLVDAPGSESEYAFYAHADWVRDRSLLEHHPDVHRQCSSPDAVGVLYRLGGAGPATSGSPPR